MTNNTIEFVRHLKKMGNIICGSIDKEYGVHDDEYRPREIQEKPKITSQASLLVL